jgi:hypothetical protein
MHIISLKNILMIMLPTYEIHKHRKPRFLYPPLTLKFFLRLKINQITIFEHYMLEKVLQSSYFIFLILEPAGSTRP